MSLNDKSPAGLQLPRRRQIILASGAVAASPMLFNIARAQARQHQDRFSDAADRRLLGRGAGPGARRRDRRQGVQRRRRLQRPQGELLVRDDKLNPGEAATRTLELIEKDKVNFIVGSLSAATQLSINAVCRDRKVLFNSISQSDAINEAKDWSLYTFHEALNPHLTAGAVARYAFPKFGKKVVYLTADYAYGHEMVRGFQRAGAVAGRADPGRHPPPAGRGRLLGLPAAHPGPQARRAGAVQLRPRPGELGQAGDRLRPQGQHEGDRPGAAVHLAPGRRRRCLRGHPRRHLLLLGHGGQDPERQGLQRQVPQGPRRRGAVRLRRARLCRCAQRAAGGARTPSRPSRCRSASRCAS